MRAIITVLERLCCFAEYIARRRAGNTVVDSSTHPQFRAAGRQAEAGRPEAQTTVPIGQVLPDASSVGTDPCLEPVPATELPSGALEAMQAEGVGWYTMLRVHAADSSSSASASASPSSSSPLSSSSSSASASVLCFPVQRYPGLQAAGGWIPDRFTGYRGTGGYFKSMIFSMF